MIFISYARDDAGTDGSARRVRDEFANRLGDEAVFLDEASIRPGTEWDPSIAAGLERAQALVLVMTSGWRERVLPKLERDGEVLRREVLTARETGKLVVPFLVGAPTPRAIGTPGFPLLEQIQWLSVPDPLSATVMSERVDTILNSVVNADLQRLVALTTDPVVNGLADLIAMREGHRRAIERAIGTDPRATSAGHRRTAALLTLVDPRTGGPALNRTGRPDGLPGALLDLQGLGPLESSPARVRAARQVLAPLIDRTLRKPTLDGALTLALDAALNRVLWNAERSGTGLPNRLAEARALLDALAQKRDRRRFLTVMRFLAEDIINTSDAALRKSLVRVEPWQTARTRQPTPRGNQQRHRRRRR